MWCHLHCRLAMLLQLLLVDLLPFHFSLASTADSCSCCHRQQFIVWNIFGCWPNGCYCFVTVTDFITLDDCCYFWHHRLAIFAAFLSPPVVFCKSRFKLPLFCHRLLYFCLCHCWLGCCRQLIVGCRSFLFCYCSHCSVIGYRLCHRQLIVTLLSPPWHCCFCHRWLIFAAAWFLAYNTVYYAVAVTVLRCVCCCSCRRWLLLLFLSPPVDCCCRYRRWFNFADSATSCCCCLCRHWLVVAIIDCCIYILLFCCGNCAVT